MKKLLYGVFFVSIVGLSFLLGNVVFADLAGYYIDNYQINLDLSVDGSMQVKENLKVVFSEPRHGIYRKIPMYNPYGKPIILENLESLENPATYSEIEGHYQLKIGDPNIFVSGQKDYHIEYEIKNAISKFLDGDDEWTELYWNIVGTERDTTINKIDFVLHLPKDIIFGLGDYYLIHGKEGEKNTEYVTMNYDEKQHLFRGTINKELLNHEGATIGIKFPSDYFDLTEEYLNIKTPVKDTILGHLGFTGSTKLFIGLFFLVLGLIAVGLGIRYKVTMIFISIFLLLGIIMLFLDIRVDILILGMSVDFLIILNIIIYLILRNIIGKNTKNLNKNNRPITIYYTPPKGINLITAAKIYNNIDISRILTALIYERAVQGELSIEQIRHKSFFISAEYNFHRKNLGQQGTKNNLIDMIFPKQVCKLSEIGLSYSTLKEVFEKIKDEQAKKTSAFYTKYRKKLLGFLPFSVERLNKKGEDLYEQIRGFKHYLSKVEAPFLLQMIKEDPLYVDRILPWAVLLDIETEFLKAIEKHLGEIKNPSWYSGIDKFSAVTLGAMTNNIISGVVPLDSGGNSSGFSGGGGSSGGGGGGGGGGSW